MRGEVALKAETAEPGFVRDSSSADSVFFDFTDAEGHMLNARRGGGRSVECLKWSELIRLPAARKLRDAPVAVVETSLGKVKLRGHGTDNEIGSPFSSEKRFLTDLVTWRNYEIPENPWSSREVPLVVNGVELRVTGTMHRRDGVWECDWQVWTTRTHRLKNGEDHATEKMREKLRTVMARELGEWLEKHPHWVEEARAVVLSNQIAGVEGEILASKVRYERACELRERLLAQERGPYDLEIG